MTLKIAVGLVTTGALLSAQLAVAQGGQTETGTSAKTPSGGIDFGIKKYREVLVFNDVKSLAMFVYKGWEISGGGSASAAAGGKGGTAGSTEVSTGAIEVYPMTDTGLAVGVAVAARKYWNDDALNAGK